MTAGYYETPNVFVPLNARDKGEIAPIALEQLALYQRVAAEWPILAYVRKGRECNTCGICDENIWFTSDQAGIKYSYTEEELTALKVAHIRQVHSDIIT